jgi:hypothetical protein
MQEIAIKEKEEKNEENRGSKEKGQKRMSFDQQKEINK